MSSINHVGLEELEIGDVSMATFEFAHVLDFIELKQDEWRIAVALCVDESEHIVTLFPAIFACEPPRECELKVLFYWSL